MKASQLDRLHELYDYDVPASSIITSDLAKSLGKASNELGRLVAVLLSRRGHIESVVLGEADRLYLPDLGRQRASASRLRGLRLLVAKPRRYTQAVYHLDRDFVTDLEKLQLDAVLQIEVQPGGGLGRAVLGMLSPTARHRVENFDRLADLDYDFTALIAELESALAKKAPKTIAGAREKAVLVGVYTGPKKQWQASIYELQELARTAKVQVLDTMTQQRKSIDPRTIVGSGKLEELCLETLHLGAEMLIFDRDLSPSQLNAITDKTDLKILDRTMLILDIFAQRAKSRAGKLQVELAQLKYSLPRLAKKQSGLSRLTGGIGGQGPGETKLEIDRRRAKDKVAKLEREIDKICRQRALTRSRRQAKKFPVIALVGYTNAGKSTLMNKLTRAEVYAQDTLFATLDPTSRALRLPSEQNAILVDTVGFIRDLPKGLVNAFRATLEELDEADLLLHVADGSDPEAKHHVKIVDEILDDLGLQDKPRLLAVNKCDLIKDPLDKAAAKQLGGIMISAEKGICLQELLVQITERINAN
ncbi:MAG: GTPase HflX [Deltaproteobacteria bacterium]|nr:GTPase HflX [Deltaproteobacteria bacterium]